MRSASRIEWRAISRIAVEPPRDAWPRRPRHQRRHGARNPPARTRARWPRPSPQHFVPTRTSPRRCRRPGLGQHQAADAFGKHLAVIHAGQHRLRPLQNRRRQEDHTVQTCLRQPDRADACRSNSPSCRVWSRVSLEFSTPTATTATTRRLCATTAARRTASGCNAGCRTRRRCGGAALVTGSARRLFGGARCCSGVFTIGAACWAHVIDRDGLIRTARAEHVSASHTTASASNPMAQMPTEDFFGLSYGCERKRKRRGFRLGQRVVAPRRR